MTYILLSTIWVYLHFFGGLRRTLFTARVRFGRSRSFKVIDFGTHRKHVCDFLLVRHSNFGPILHCFRDIAGFCAYDLTVLFVVLSCIDEFMNLDLEDSDF